MASANDDIGISPMLALPPIGGFAGQISGDEFPRILLGQNSPPGAAACVEDTPPIRRINAHSDDPSAMSGMTTTPNTATASVHNRKRSSAYSDSSDDDEPSPKKALPDFSLRKGKEDSVVSGDDSEGWCDMEEENLADNLSAQAKVDDALDEAAFPDIPMNEVNEWELMEGEGNADDDIPIANAPPEYETIRIGYQKTTIKVLTDVAQRLGIAKTGVKRKLFDRIRNSTHVVKVDDDSFDYQREIIPGEVFPTWIILTPEPVPAVPGIDMATGAQTGFFGPTNKENAVGGVRQNFITQDGERIVRPIVLAARSNRTTNKHGGPSPAARKKIPNLKCARPKDFFDLQITPEFVTWITCATNRRATSDGAGCGTGEFNDWVSFDEAELYRFFRVLFANDIGAMVS